MSRSQKQILAIYLSLTVITLIAFWQVSRCDFINFDDPDYVAENVHVRNGITAEALKWAFTTGHAANWHPLTWTSHMLDVQLFGLNPKGHHLTSLLFHIANTLLLFFVLHRMTNAPWKSAFVAALFAVHPLHVESVAWVAERKDVLSTFFWMLTMIAYIHYVKHPRLSSYLAVFVFLALGLMAKPMLVTIPCVLLALDYWPLHRFEQREPVHETLKEADKPVSGKKRKGKSSRERTAPAMVKERKPRENKYRWALIRRLLWEKIPFFALAVLSSIVTFIAQEKGGTISSLQGVQAGERIANALVSYVIYIGKTIWPENLALLYLHPGFRPLWQVAGAVLLLTVITSTVIRTAKRRPYLAVGWLWFAGTLVPVIGIVQVGRQAMADRYTYVPLIGLFIMIAWGIPELLKKWRYCKETLFVSSTLICLGLLIITWTQVGYWHNNISIYDHTLKISNYNYLIHYNRGVAYLKLGDCNKAISDFDTAIEIKSEYAEAYGNRGVAYGILGNLGRAIEDFNKAIEIDPKYTDAYKNRGITYDKLGEHGQATEDMKAAAKLNNEDAKNYLRNHGVNW
jgi:tetratricopeptide (TPR) repeat protein